MPDDLYAESEKGTVPEPRLIHFCARHVGPIMARSRRRSLAGVLSRGVRGQSSRDEGVRLNGLVRPRGTLRWLMKRQFVPVRDGSLEVFVSGPRPSTLVTAHPALRPGRRA